MSIAELCLQVSSPSLLDRYRGLLTEAELQHVAEGSSAAVQQERLLTRALVRSTLAR